MKRLFPLSAFALAIASPSISEGPADARAKWEAEHRAEQVYYKQQFDEAGFVPIDEIEAGERNVRRLSLRDGYGMLGIPGVEFERRGGKVTMRLQYREYRTAPVTLRAGVWDRIIAGDKSMFYLPEYRPAPKEPPSANPNICHGWMAFVQATRNRTGSWWQCRDTAGPKQDAIGVMIEVAMATRPDCKAEKDSRWAFQKCFGEKLGLDDPKLDEIYSKLVKELQDAPGAVRMGAARRAVRTPGLTMGSPAWLEAREAVRQVLELEFLRRATLQKLIELDYRASDASKPDKVKMRRTIRHWSEFIAAQGTNHVEILSGLVWTRTGSADK